MIETNVLMQLSKATFSLVDETFEGHPACENCPLNTKNSPNNEGGVLEPRCMNRKCFIDKTTQRIFREAKMQPVGVEIVYQGTSSENDALIKKAGEFGVLFPQWVSESMWHLQRNREERISQNRNSIRRGTIRGNTKKPCSTSV
jgi:hypothetical protein